MAFAFLGHFDIDNNDVVLRCQAGRNLVCGFLKEKFMAVSDTIFALSSASGFAGVAVVRISGPKALDVAEKLAGLKNPKPRYAHFVTLTHKNKIIDKALLIYFKAPSSFTGEDVVEIQCHGSRAVLKALFSILSDISGCRMAEAGEFTRRAVYNNKMDLTAAEGLIDLIHAETEAQRAAAVRQMGGTLQKLYDGWREELVKTMAYVEAFIDFPDEEIPPEQAQKIADRIKDIRLRIQKHLADDNGVGQRLKDGFQIAIVGAPNVGKSSLLNAITRTDKAIVSDIAGTTRDVIEVHLDVSGYPVILADTAGLRKTRGVIEGQGVQKAIRKALDSDLLLAVGSAENYPRLDEKTQDLVKKHPCSLVVWNKTDKKPVPATALSVCAKTGQGVEVLMARIRQRVEDKMSCSSAALVTQLRYKTALKECDAALMRAQVTDVLELKAEELRLAARALGKITGFVRTEELLDVIFSSFCIGK